MRRCSTILLGALALSACNLHIIINGDDEDGDGLSSARELSLGTDPLNADTDFDRVWDGEEVDLFDTDPLRSDTDADGMSDRADPRPATFDSAIPSTEHGVFSDNATGTARSRLSSTRYQENHVVQGPDGAGYLIYQTYLADVNGDGNFDESDLTASAIAKMNLDGARPRLLTDRDSSGFRASNGAIDATPHVSPDGRFVIFASNRHATSSSQLRLYVMEIDGASPRQLGYASASAAPLSNELESDCHWGAGDRIVWKRELISSGPRASRLYTGTLNRVAWRLENVVQRTDPAPGTLDFFPPGDYDPQLSPDGQWIASYRHLADAPGAFGDWDVFVGRTSDPQQPADASLTFLAVDPDIADFFPRWDQSGTRLALWSLDSMNAADPFDVLVFELDLSGAAPAVTQIRNLTNGEGWDESMPSWSTDQATPNRIFYSASR